MSATIDRAVFNELRDTAGAEFVKDLVGTFLEEAPAMMEQLRKALAARDADTFRRAAHSMKSNSLTFGAASLAAIAKDLELSGLENALARGPKPLEALAEEYARVAMALSELRDA